MCIIFCACNFYKYQLRSIVSVECQRVLNFTQCFKSKHLCIFGRIWLWYHKAWFCRWLSEEKCTHFYFPFRIGRWRPPTLHLSPPPLLITDTSRKYRGSPAPLPPPDIPPLSTSMSEGSFIHRLWKPWPSKYSSLIRSFVNSSI